MAPISAAELGRYLLYGQICSRGCVRVVRQPSSCLYRTSFSRAASSIGLADGRGTPTASQTPIVPLRKQLKDQAKALKSSGKKKKAKADNQTVPGWELTVGIEIHAQLNTAKKLFSTATTSFNDSPNTHVALFDLALPGSQPVFQREALVPALRAALAFECDIQKISRFDRKHYFHWDQPSGYQITQYYEPFAKDGKIVLHARDGIAPEDGESVTVGIKQIQMEQDTAKTIAQPGEMQWLDFNRVGVPLIEIITLPQIHHPATAAALVRKIQLLLSSVDACVLGMEAGGLRADVNVSVRRIGDVDGPLGTRTEIKNLSSFRAVEDAIIAERDRQIALLESGGVVEGETRGWSLGSSETRRLRGKEGEVDYRYMPDPDLGPVVIGQDLVQHLSGSLGMLPDVEIDHLMDAFGLSSKDAISLMLLDGGGRLQFFYKILDAMESQTGQQDASHAVLAANWCLHELGKLTAASAVDVETSSNDLGMTPDGDCRIAATDLAEILVFLHQRRITAKVAKELLWKLFYGDIGSSAAVPTSIATAIDQNQLWFEEVSEQDYIKMAEEVVLAEERVLDEFRKFHDGQSKAYPQGKLMFLVGQMMRRGPEGGMDPQSAERHLRALVDRRISGMR
jgi:aspartyl-tRNA(Asn)/glutamyl-tRNA(Gln) amidotransferase subunit B